MGYFVNFSGYQAWATLVIDMEIQSEIFITFHGLGRKDTGVLAVAALFFTRQEPGEFNETIIGDIKPLSDDPFLLTYEESEHDVIARFQPWLEERLILGLDRWRNLIGA